jgi:hypothetical protein
MHLPWRVTKSCSAHPGPLPRPAALASRTSISSGLATAGRLTAGSFAGAIRPGPAGIHHVPEEDAMSHTIDNPIPQTED